MEFTLPTDWIEFIELLTSKEVEFLVVGAFAMAYHNLPRSTGDIDFFVGQNLANAERLVAAITEFGFGYLATNVDDFMQPNAFIMLGHEPGRIDLITGISGVSFEEAWRDRVFGELGGKLVPFLSRDHLLKNKLASGRTKDKADAERLMRQG